jgi:Domain of unknown function (DU1801)
MAETKTKPTDVNVDDFIEAVPNEEMRADSRVLLKMMQKATKKKPKMWGPTMIGFGDFHYKYASGHEGDTFLIGFSPRKAAISLYLSCAIEEHAPLLNKLGKHKTGKGCLYVKRLSDIDLKVLEQLITVALKKCSEG